MPDASSLQHLPYPRLPMPGLASSLPMPGMAGLPYSGAEQSPYSSISMENFYSPLVSNRHKFITIQFVTLVPS
jgi:hypothetical protein